MEKESCTLRPSLLDIVAIDGRLAQVDPGERSILFLDDKARLGRNLQLHNMHEIDWGDYDFIEGSSGFVSFLRDKGEISSDEYMAVRWGPEQEENPHLRDFVRFFGRYESKKRKI